MRRRFHHTCRHPIRHAFWLIYATGMAAFLGIWVSLGVCFGTIDGPLGVGGILWRLGGLIFWLRWGMPWFLGGVIRLALRQCMLLPARQTEQGMVERIHFSPEAAEAHFGIRGAVTLERQQTAGMPDYDRIQRSTR